MFTGIIEEMAEIVSLSENKLTLSRPDSFSDVAIGSSIAVAGVCLSAIDRTRDSMTFDVVGETLRKTTLGSLQPGARVNLERALPANGRFDGHIVQGHAEGVGEVTGVKQDGEWTLLTVTLPKDVLPYVVSKGSLAIDGVSLTIAEKGVQSCTVALIPHTMAHTTLGVLREGDAVNIETDILGRYIHSMASGNHEA